MPIDAGAGTEANEANEEVMVNPLKEEAYHALACLMMKRGFRPDFFRTYCSVRTSSTISPSGMETSMRL